MNTVRILLFATILAAINTLSCEATDVRDEATPSERSGETKGVSEVNWTTTSQTEIAQATKVGKEKGNTSRDAESEEASKAQAKNNDENEKAQRTEQSTTPVRVAEAKGENAEEKAIQPNENAEAEKTQIAAPKASAAKATEKQPTEQQTPVDKTKKEAQSATAVTAAASAPTRRQFKKITTKGIDIELGKSCVTAECHSDMSEAKFLHGPVAISACAACHKTVGKPGADGKTVPTHQFTFEKLGNDLCYSCHNRQDTGEVVHEPVKKELCTICHDSHKSENKFLLIRATIGETCLTCHEDNINKQDKYAHGPVAVGACVTCHSSHSSANKKLLVAPGNELCFLCHDKIKTELATLKYQHKAAVENCSQCHTHHTSPNKFQLKKTIPQLCADCHAEQVMQTEVAVTKHGAITSGDKCLNCHGPHATNYPHELREAPIDLCLRCHNKEIETPTGTIINMKAELANHSNHHGPIRQGNCVPCHNVHGSEFFRLLDKYFPPEFYAPFKVEKYSLCFKCHDETLVLDERTTRLTDFRNGDQNLHYLHIHKETKGRTCRACHQVHASDNPKHIRDWTFFGPMKWKLPIDFKKTETGGSCAPGCHKPKDYDRVKPADYGH